MKSLRLRIANLCCAGEERIIRRVIGDMNHIEELSVNVIGRYAVMKHCSIECCAPASTIVDNLNKERLGASIQEHYDAAEEEQEEKISWVVLLHAVGTTVFFIVCSIFDGVHKEDHTLDNPVNKMYLVCASIGCIPIAYAAGVSLMRRTLDINLLVMIALIGSFAGLDFRDGALVVVLFIIAQLLEEVIMKYVRNAIKISSSNVGRFAVLMTGSEQMDILLEDLRIGDRIVVRTGDMVPIDGDVAMGQAVVDESAITGEAEFIHKGVGAKVVSGSIVQNGYIEVIVSVELKDSMMRKLNDTVDDVQASKGTVATIVDSFAAYWTPLIVLSAVLFVSIGGLASGSWHSYVNKGLVLLVLACPCSIVLAAPVASLSGIAAAAKHGVVIKGSAVIETLGCIDAVTLDKTGTLTKGSFSVLERYCLKLYVIYPTRATLISVMLMCCCRSCPVPYYVMLISLRFRTEKEEEEEEDETTFDPMKLAAALEDKSSHPLASAIVSKFCGCIAEMKNPLPNSKKIHIHDGVGVEGWVEYENGEWVHVAVGNDRMLKGFVSLKQNNENNGGKAMAGAGKCRLKKEQQIKLNEFISRFPTSTVVFVAVEDELAMCIALGDVIRPESKAVVAQLAAMNCKVVMLTGDAAPVAEQTCRELHIPECRSRLHPEDKLRAVNELKAQGKKVLMLGDGINDTTALAAADVGVAMGAAGSAMAVKAADVVLMTDSLTKLASTIAIGKLTRGLIFQNVIFSVVVKIIAIVLALTGFLLLWHAILIDVATLFVVIGNGVRPLCCGIYERNESLDTYRSESYQSTSSDMNARIQLKISNSSNTGNPERHTALQTGTAKV
jgi:Cd2+/Zn2+-exporting ATPase